MPETPLQSPVIARVRGARRVRGQWQLCRERKDANVPEDITCPETTQRGGNPGQRVDGG